MSSIQSLIGRTTAAPVVTALTNKSFTFVGTGNGVSFAANGSHGRIRNNSTDFGYVGEWVASGATSTVGNGYEVRAIYLGGSGIAVGSDLFSTWYSLASTIVFTLNTTGQFDIEIRPVAGAVVATARITIT